MPQTGSTNSLSNRLALTYREAATSIGLSERKLWQLVHDGKLKAKRTGRAVRIPVAEIERFLSDS